MVAHGYVMVGLGLVLFYLRATMSNLFFYVFGGAFAFLERQAVKTAGGAAELKHARV
jgi:hypothetical protein